MQDTSLTVPRAGATFAPVLLLLLSMLVGSLLTATAFAAEQAGSSANAGAASSAAETPPPPPDLALQQGVESDPFEPFNSAMFTFNLKLDDWILHPVASGYADVAPEAVRQAVGRFFDNVEFVPRFANNLFQLRLPQAGGEVARFGINTTLGLGGFFDPAGKWFGLKKHPDDFGLTLRYYDVPTGPYLMLPFYGPATVGDAIGKGVDSFMDPEYYFMPLWMSFAVGGGETIADEVNYRSLHLNQFEEADRYAIDLYGAVQDAYLQIRRARLRELKQGD